MRWPTSFQRSMRRGRRGAGALPAWLALGPAFSYRPLPSYVVLDGSTLVRTLADELAPLDSTRWLEQATGSDRPAWLASSSLPSGVPAVQGDGISDYLVTAISALAASFGGAPYTMLMLGVQGALAATRTPAGSGASVGVGSGRARFSPGANLRGQQDAVTVTGSVAAAGAQHWAQLSWDGATASFADSLGGVASVAAPSSVVDLLSVAARMNNGAPLQFDDGEIAWFLGYQRVLSAAEQAAVQSNLSAYGGLP